jgi:Protein of unknown function (DUF3375)
MPLDYATLEILRSRHPAWRLLRSDHTPLVAGFLHRLFIAPNVRTMAAADLAEKLEDELFALRERVGADTFPRPAMDYLNDWANPEKAGCVSSIAQARTSRSSTSRQPPRRPLHGWALSQNASSSAPNRVC